MGNEILCDCPIVNLGFYAETIRHQRLNNDPDAIPFPLEAKSLVCALL